MQTGCLCVAQLQGAQHTNNRGYFFLRPELIALRRGAFKDSDANGLVGWLPPYENLGFHWPVVLVCENAPVHSKYELAAQEFGNTLLRLGPYFPMLSVARVNQVPVLILAI